MGLKDFIPEDSNDGWSVTVDTCGINFQMEIPHYVTSYNAEIVFVGEDTGEGMVSTVSVPCNGLLEDSRIESKKDLTKDVTSEIIESLIEKVDDEHNVKEVRTAKIKEETTVRTGGERWD